MFIGRARELATLEQLYQRNTFQFVVMYGRRRVGKTALLTHFIQDKKAIYFMGVESNAKQNLENMSASIFSTVLGGDEKGNVSFSSFQEALEFVFKRSQKEQLIFVIDEYPYVARASRSLASTLQLVIDKYKDTSRLMLVLCGSSMSYMEDHVLAYKAPLYGRRTGQLKIQPFDFAETCQYFPHFSPYDKALAYGIVGGTPQYLLQLQDQCSMEDNIKQTFLNPASSLFEEPENLLKQEVREPALYNAIITAIATGASRLADIAMKVGETTSVCSIYLKNLMSLGLIKRETPYGEKASRKSIYCIDDNMFRFWYRFIPENLSIIARGATDLAYRRIAPHISDYMGHVFEEICKQYLWHVLLHDASPVQFTDLGRWWGTDPTTRKQTEIDIMGVQDKCTALFGECKWTEEKVNYHVLETLEHRSSLFSYPHVTLYLFAKTGFTDTCIEEAKKRGNVQLVTYPMIVQSLVQPEDGVCKKSYSTIQ